MTKLSPRHREIVTLVGRDAKTYQQVADELGISRFTVANHIRVIAARAPHEGKPQAVLAKIYWTEVA